VILSALLMSIGTFTGLIGVVADLIAVNRQLLEKLLMQQAQSIETARPAPTVKRERRASAA
jgi:hypothetical protein